MSKANLLRKEARLGRASERKVPGPKPEVLTIDGKWQDAVKKTFGKKKPVNGWPK